MKSLLVCEFRISANLPFSGLLFNYGYLVTNMQMIPKLFPKLIIVVIITWTGEKTSQKITLTSQLTGSVIRSNGS